MDTKILIIATLFVIFIILAVIIVMAVMRFSNTAIKNESSTPAQKPKELTLQDLIDTAENPKSDKNDLFVALKIFSNSFAIPRKNGSKAPPEAKLYLRFVSALASNPKADAKLIAFMNTELIKRNPDYAQEIDSYEKSGLSRRR